MATSVIHQQKAITETITATKTYTPGVNARWLLIVQQATAGSGVYVILGATTGYLYMDTIYEAPNIGSRFSVSISGNELTVTVVSGNIVVNVLKF